MDYGARAERALQVCGTEDGYRLRSQRGRRSEGREVRARC
jgi:hypothetical protein